MVTNASPNNEHLEFVDDIVEIMCKKIMELRIQSKNNDGHNSDNLTVQCHDIMQSKEFKKQYRLKRQKWFKSWVEMQLTKKKVLVQSSISGRGVQIQSNPKKKPKTEPKKPKSKKTDFFWMYLDHHVA